MSDYGKYIIVEHLPGVEVAILFSHLISHCDFMNSFRGISIKAAGFFQIQGKPSLKDKDDIEVVVFGKSVTLKTEVRKGKDERLIKEVLRKIREY